MIRYDPIRLGGELGHGPGVASATTSTNTTQGDRPAAFHSNHHYFYHDINTISRSTHTISGCGSKTTPS